jgi:hypothetical protein
VTTEDRSDEMMRRQGKQAAVLLTPKLVWVETLSGRGLMGADPLGVGIALPVDVDDASLGRVVAEALSKSRFLTTPEARALFDRNSMGSRYESWVNGMMLRFGYSSRRALFKSMARCDICLHGVELILTPSTHPKLEAWEGVAEESNIVASRDSSDHEIGSAVREGLSRCRV